jgi:hypothetical protein
MTVNNVHHQNSDLDAQPLKSAYLMKQIFTASIKFIYPLSVVLRNPIQGV